MKPTGDRIHFATGRRLHPDTTMVVFFREGASVTLRTVEFISEKPSSVFCQIHIAVIVELEHEK